ncbi:MAG: ABC transporter ATP-binding protein [Phycisphaerae bacterium]|jgi:peptide/nickel transport system ATP-binding protein/oligopeptide transport system ATP-binding protein
MSGNLLTIDNLSVHFSVDEGLAKAVQNVSFAIEKGKTFALVGESGCGKSVTALSIMRLIPEPPGKIVSGKILLENRDLLKLSEKRMRRIRGNRIAMIFQEPMTSLNPVFTVGDQIAEAITLHQKKDVQQAWNDAVEMLKKVGIGDAQRRAFEYPHQMSGGMRQRVMIAMAMSCEPELIIADEPTTALDVTIQAQILDLLDELQRQNNMGILLITHDLGIVAERADDVAVMYASRIAERAAAAPLFAEPLHPYTQGLLHSVPQLGFEGRRLATIPGIVPDPLNFPTGCKFHPRCPVGGGDKRCQCVEPELREVRPGRCVACWYAPGYQTQQEHEEYESKYK